MALAGVFHSTEGFGGFLLVGGTILTIYFAVSLGRRKARQIASSIAGRGAIGSIIDTDLGKMPNSESVKEKILGHLDVR
jgi:hypothetical protein